MASEKKTRQINMRFTPKLIDDVDRARATAEPGPDGRPPSRTLWIERAIRAFLPKSLTERLASETAGSAEVASPPVAPDVPTGEQASREPDPQPDPGPADHFEEHVTAREKQLVGQIPSKLMRRKIAEKDVRAGWRP